MNSAYSRAQAEDFLEQCSSVSGPSDMSSGTTIASESLPPESVMESCPTRPSSAISKHSSVKDVRSFTGALRTSLRVDSHAKTFQSPEPGKVFRGGQDQDCGMQWPKSLASLDPVSSLWKIRQCSLFEDSVQSLEIFPEWGMWEGGQLWGVSVPANVSTESACGLSLQGPTASDSFDPRFRLKSLLRWHHPNGNLKEQVAQRFLRRITPLCTEILMDWPEGWSDSRPLETGKMQDWLQQHGGY